MLRVLLGIVKGGVVGAAVGFGAARLGLGGGITAWLVYGALGFLVGIVCGRPIWRQETPWTPILKGIFGVLVSMGLYWVATKTVGGMKLPFAEALGAGPDTPLRSLPQVLAPALGIIYGLFVEFDDGDRKGKEAPPPGAEPPKKAA
jgi:hypothetical protein